MKAIAIKKNAMFRGRDVLWLIDNTSAMHAFVRGASANELLEEIVAAYWFLAFELRARVWLEWVDSKSNWADGISREFANDEFVQKHGFQVREVTADVRWWHANLENLWQRARRELSRCG